jgi:phage regulator Rha-like protein
MSDQTPVPELVRVDHGRPVTTSLVIADGAKAQHKNVLALVREHRADLEEFGPVAFETRQGSPLPQGGFGATTEHALLNEQQATVLITFMRNTITVRALKVRLVREFYRTASELRRIRAQRVAPDWQAARLEAKHEHRNVCDMLKEVRAEVGKESAAHVFINESKLLRFAMTGAESAKWDRDHLSRDDLRLLGRVERLDMRLLAKGVSFKDRKAACRALVIEERGLLLVSAGPPARASRPRRCRLIDVGSTAP